MLNVRPVVHILGWIACALALVLCLPAVTDRLYGNPEWEAFAAAGAIAGFLGLVGVLATKTKAPTQINIRQAFLVTMLGWVVVCLLSAIPFLHVGIGFADAVFESMSAITTTGSTVLVNLDQLPPGILLWRAILQWVGGLGVLAIAILILPLLRVGGMQIFKIESSDISEEKIFNAVRTVLALFAIYAGLTVICFVLYQMFGMTPFDALTHAMTTLSTGGYSTHDSSFGYFTDLRLHWVANIFMVAGAVPFLLYIKTVRGDMRALITDQQVKGFLLFLVIVSVVMAAWLMTQRDIDFGNALTLTSFNVISIVTTTGFASDDYTTWGSGAVGVFLVLMFIGGCSGSTSGAIKIYRHQILWAVARSHVKRLFSPNRVVPLRYNGRLLPSDIPTSVLAFLAVFIATITVFTLALTFMGLDIVTAYSASVTAITNVGPGLGPIIGPAGNFATLPDAAKWLLTLAMLAGRLEVLALLVAFDPDFWRT